MVLFGIITVIIIMVIVFFAMASKSTKSKKYAKIINDYKKIGAAMEKYKNDKKALPLDIYSLEDYAGDLELGIDSYDLSDDKRSLMVKNLDLDTKTQLKSIFKSRCHIEKGDMALHYTDQKKGSTEPVAVIDINPNFDILTTTPVTFSSRNSKTEEKEIKAEEWKGAQEIYREPGDYEVSLRVMDKYETWSSWETKTISVKEVRGIQEIVMTKDDLFAIEKNGKVYEIYERPDENEDSVVYAFRRREDIDNVKQMVSGENHIYYLKHNGAVYSRGANEAGQLGVGNLLDSDDENRVSRITKAKKITSGNEFGAAVMFDGSVMTWGANDRGQLGDDSNANKQKPVTLKKIEKIKDIYCGEKHCIAITFGNMSYGWGFNKHGQLGNGTRVDEIRPSQTSLEKVVKAQCGRDYTVFLLETGKVYSCGNNSHGQLGIASTKTHSHPVKIEELKNIVDITSKGKYNAAIDDRGEVYVWGAFESQEKPIRLPERMPCEKAIKQVVIGKDEAYALAVDNTVWAWNEECDQMMFFTDIRLED